MPPRRRLRAQRVSVSRGIRNLVPSVGAGFPRSMEVTLAYSDFQLYQVQMSTLPILWTFALNSIYDPDVTFTGHQPMYRDQLAAIYSKYIVKKAHVEINMIPNGTTNAPIAGCVWASPTLALGGTSSDMRDAAERGQSGLHISSAVKPWSYRRMFPINQVLGLPLNQYLVRSSYTDVGSNPSQLAVLQVWASAMDSSSNVGVSLSISIRMVVEFSDLKDVGTS